MNVLEPLEYFLLSRLSVFGIIASAILSLISFSYEPPIPDSYDLVPMIQGDPVQVETSRERFTMKKLDREYFVEPVFDYELWGVVVSVNNLNSIIDPYNVKHEVRAKDFCIIWGENAFDQVMDYLGVYSENYTCYFNAKQSGVDWDDIRLDQLSNNHLLATDPKILKTIEKVEVGDQIHFKGSLVNYGSAKDGYTIRKTSTRRDDRGDGACETIFVDELTVVKKSTPFFSLLLDYALYALVFFVLLKVVLPFLRVKHNLIRDDKINRAKLMDLVRQDTHIEDFFKNTKKTVMGFYKKKDSPSDFYK